jgi:hypothetical protein
MIYKNKKGMVAFFIIAVVSLLLTFLCLVIVYPIMEPFLSGLTADPLTKFFMLVIPFWLVFMIPVSIFVGGRTA